MASQAEFKGLKILLVDDNQDARTMLRDMLSELDIMQVFEAPEGGQALKFIDAAFDPMDIIICDWNMPGMSGVEFLRQIRTVYPELPFLMVTGRSDLDSVVEAKTSGVTGYITKPFSKSQIEAKLRIINSQMCA